MRIAGLGTVDGLFRLEDGTWTTFKTAEGLANADVCALLEDRAGNLWIGTVGGGVQRFGVPPSGGSALTHEAGSGTGGSPVRIETHGRDARATTAALDLLKPGLRTFTTFNTTNGLSANSVWTLHEDAAGALWIGTEGGLNRLKDGRILSFTTREGLAADAINCILEDNFGRLWLSHDHGLFWVRKQDFEDVAAGRLGSLRNVSYDETDGLLRVETNGQKSNPAGCKTRAGRLWFPTTRGDAVIDPKKIADDEVPPLAAIDLVRANGEIVFDTGPANPAQTWTNLSLESRHSPLRLPPGSARVLEFHFTANTFRSCGL